MADEGQFDLLSIDGVIITHVGEDDAGNSELRVVLDRSVDDLEVEIPPLIGGLPVRVFENKTVRFQDGRTVISDKDETELEELQEDVLIEAVTDRGDADDYFALLEHLAEVDGSREDMAQVVVAGLQQHPHDTRLQDYVAPIGFSLSRLGNDEAVAYLASTLGGVADSHVAHFNAGQLYESVGKRKKAKRHYQAALELARSAEDESDALEGLARLRKS